ncbi:hypothetical protein [Archangium primigenium]|uniref:hypothetical protein n=1 Tax=[Archangium] primigenium TaxID=2792470 RepID=UPI001958B8E0|nr:hypothetical protein [Archangium primigenium]MBM7118849.1 hypothetical protein [Archangium primigenium]
MSISALSARSAPSFANTSAASNIAAPAIASKIPSEVAPQGLEGKKMLADSFDGADKAEGGVKQLLQKLEEVTKTLSQLIETLTGQKQGAEGGAAPAGGAGEVKNRCGVGGAGEGAGAAPAGGAGEVKNRCGVGGAGGGADAAPAGGAGGAAPAGGAGEVKDRCGVGGAGQAGGAKGAGGAERGPAAIIEKLTSALKDIIEKLASGDASKIAEAGKALEKLAGEMDTLSPKQSEGPQQLAVDPSVPTL